MQKENTNTKQPIVLGTMTFGKQTSEEEALKMVEYFMNIKDSSKEVDSALMYPSLKTQGITEQILGRILKKIDHKYTVSTKSHPWGFEGDNTLSEKSIKNQFELNSLKNLDLPCVDIWYLHSPDHTTDIEVTLKAVNHYYQLGKFKELGLSNYASWEVAEIYYISKKNGWVLPTVYQGLYNPITRGVEKELFPCLRRLGIRFYAYNVTCGGLLTGKHNNKEQLPSDGSRFDSNEQYQSRYWKESYFQAIETIRIACEKFNIPMAEASHRYMLHHSKMDRSLGDKVIVGCSKIEHLIQNVESCIKDKLPNEIVEAFNEGARLTYPYWFEYFR